MKRSNLFLTSLASGFLGVFSFLGLFSFLPALKQSIYKDNPGSKLVEISDYFQFDFRVITPEKKEAFLKKINEVRVLYDKLGQEPSWGLLCELYALFEDWDNTILSCEKDLKIWGPSLRNMSGLSVAYIKAQKYDKAIKTFKNHLKSDVKKVPEYLGNIYYILGDYPEAIKYYQQVSKIESKKFGYSYANAKIGLIFLRTQQFTKAENELLTLLNFMESSIKKGAERFGIALSSEMFSYEFYIYSILQELWIEQKNYEKALEFLERGLGFVTSLYRVSGKNESLDIVKIKDMAKEEQATLVFYSKSFYHSPLDAVEKGRIFIYVVQPNGKLHFREVNLTVPKKDEVSINTNLQTSNMINNLKISLQIIAILFTVLSILASVFLLLKRQNSIALKISTIIITFISLPILIFQFTIKEKVTRSNELYDESIKEISKATLISIANSQAGISGISSDYFIDGFCHENDKCLKLFYNLLIKPITEFLPQNPEEKVIFINSGAFSHIPFPALKSSNGQFLIEKHTILTAPSVRLMKLAQQNTQKNKNLAKQALVVGNPVMRNYSIGDHRQESLLPLPATEREVKKIANLLGTEPIIGKQATELEVRKKIPKAKVIHLATHGVTWFSVKGALIFTPEDLNSVLNVEDSTSQNNGVLTHQEIRELDVNADLVVLSACETGIGKPLHDGALSFIRPFLLSGASSVVSSLWQVQDEPTEELMVEFYKNLKTMPSKAQALRAAMLTTMKKYPEPDAWGAFILVGDEKNNLVIP